jgi:hypothetical protein
MGELFIYVTWRCGPFLVVHAVLVLASFQFSIVSAVPIDFVSEPRVIPRVLAGRRVLAARLSG